MQEIVKFARVAIETLRYPGENVQMTAVVMGILLAFVSLTILFFIYLRLVKKSISERKTSKSRSDVFYHDWWLRWIGRSLGIALFLLILLGQYGAQPVVCAKCHQKIFESFNKSPHKEKGCLSCHQEPGMTGYVLQKLDYVRWLFTDQSQIDPQTVTEAYIDSSACLSCHGSVFQGTLKTRAMRVRHADFKDYRCIDCHNSTGHKEGVNEIRVPDMRSCLVCHDARRASASCVTCHSGDIASASGTVSWKTRADVIKIPAPLAQNCRGCHSIAKCTACHGLEMPHPRDWVPNHARTAFTNKETCWRCHGESQGNGRFGFCNRCHRFPGPHRTGWIAKHASAATEMRGSIPLATCKLCHTNERFCELCHGSKQQVFN